MNSKTVLSKIMAMLSLDNVELTYAKLKDGTIVESPTFDVGEPLDIVSEDGSKSPAPDGEHELALRDESGNENIIKVIAKDGMIVERENVELETVKVEDIPQASGEPMKENEQADLPNQVKSGTLMAEETEEVMPISEDESEVEMNLGDMAKKMEEMAYRIEEMENKMMKMEETMMPPVSSEVTEEVAGIKMAAEPDEEEEELPKLDGAPIEEASRFSEVANTKNNYGKRVENSQSNFLSKLYK
jgi:hypothetical protein